MYINTKGKSEILFSFADGLGDKIKIQSRLILNDNK